MDSFVSIDGWNAKIQFSAAHVIPEYEKCGRLHGHTYAIHAKLHGPLDEKGIIIDFSLVKKLLSDIAETLDHKILIPSKSKVVTIKHEDHLIHLHSLGKTYQFPESDCVLLPISSSSAEHLAEFVLLRFLSLLPSDLSLTRIEIGVNEGFGQGAWISKTIK